VGLVFAGARAKSIEALLVYMDHFIIYECFIGKRNTEKCSYTRERSCELLSDKIINRQRR
jgi:hypothetical protein